MWKPTLFNGLFSAGSSRAGGPLLVHMRLFVPDLVAAVSLLSRKGHPCPHPRKEDLMYDFQKVQSGITVTKKIGQVRLEVE